MCFESQGTVFVLVLEEVFTNHALRLGLGGSQHVHPQRSPLTTWTTVVMVKITSGAICDAYNEMSR